MKRRYSITVDDSQTRVEITLRVNTRSGHLTRDEVDRLGRVLVRRTVASLDGVPYTDFGIENMRVRP